MRRPDSRITIFVDSDELLRKKWKGLPAAEQAFRKQAGEQSIGNPLEGDVSVAMTLHAGAARQPPQIPSAVKAYLDALEGVAYFDDRQVAHLQVRRNALDHPWLEQVSREGSPVDDKVAAFIEVMPARDYSDLFDRAHRNTFLRGKDAHSPWRPRLTVKDHSELTKLRWRASGRMPPALDEHGRELLRMREEAKLLDGSLVDIDRPGPLPVTTRAIHRVLPLDRMHHSLRKRWGSVFMLPLRGEREGSSRVWKEEVAAKLASFRDKQPGVPFESFVSLDVAV